MGTPALVRQRPGWWTQFGRSLLAGLAQTGMGLGEAMLRGYIQDYFRKQAEQRAFERRKALENTAYEFSRRRAEGLAKQQREMAEQRYKQAAFQRAARMLAGAPDPKIAAEGMRAQVLGREYLPGPRMRLQAAMAPLETMPQTMASVGTAGIPAGGQPAPQPPPSYKRAVDWMARLYSTLPKQEPVALKQVEAQQARDILKAKLDMLKEKYKEANRRGRMREAAILRAEINNMQNQFNAILRHKSADPTAIWTESPKQWAQPSEELLQEFESRVMPRRRSVLPKPRRRAARALPTAGRGMGESDLEQQLYQYYLQQPGATPELAREAAKKLMQSTTSEQIRQMIGG